MPYRLSVTAILALVCFQAEGLRAQDGKAVVPFVSGMTIVTEDAGGTVEIRAQSLGPGFCATRFIANTHSIDILAPPFIWSEWQELTSHLGSINMTLSSVVMCDTDAVGEVRYFPADAN